ALEMDAGAETREIRRESGERALKPRSSIAAGSAVAICVFACGCEQSHATIQADSPEMASFVQLILPRTIEIQHYLTKPHSFDGSGDANGVEVLLATKDSTGDEVKCVGTISFELYAKRMASGDPYGQRFGVWTITINSGELLKQYWDRPSKFYKFPLQLDGGTLPPGKYILKAQFTGPTGDKLFDEYAFTHSTSATSKPDSAKHETKDTKKKR